jgi:hypothetical protein
MQQTFERTVYLNHLSIATMGEAGMEIGDEGREVRASCTVLAGNMLTASLCTSVALRSGGR